MNDESLNVGVLGDGAWGTALATVLLRNGHRPTVWGPFPDYIETVRRSRLNSMYLPEVPLPPGIEWTADGARAAAGKDLLVLAMPTKYFRSVLTSFRGIPPPGCLLISVAKGFDPSTRKRMSEVAEELLPGCPVAALSGPSYAAEVARGVPTALTAASRHAGAAERAQQVFANAFFRVYTTDDVVGVELSGGLKNVIAVGVGVSDGLGFGDNTRAALITRGLVEITRLGCAMGAKPVTFSGLSGMGDLIVTCTGKLSRNRHVGERLGRGETVESILGGMHQAAEGVWNCAIARSLAREHGVAVPITDEVYAMIHEAKPPLDSVRSLMTRDRKPE
jgi:glycerol-3-phosphate dehydrogenase (NAD(P)+)